MKLSELKTEDQLQFELIKRGWRKGTNRTEPCPQNPEQPYFCMSGLDDGYFRGISLFLPQLPGHGNNVSISATVNRDGEIYEWDAFSLYSGFSEEIEQPELLELNSIEIGGFLLDWVNGQLKEELS